MSCVSDVKLHFASHQKEFDPNNISSNDAVSHLRINKRRYAFSAPAPSPFEKKSFWA